MSTVGSQPYKTIDVGKTWDNYSIQLEYAGGVDTWFVTVNHFRLGKPLEFCRADCVAHWLCGGALQSMFGFLKDDSGLVPDYKPDDPMLLLVRKPGELEGELHRGNREVKRRLDQLEDVLRKLHPLRVAIVTQQGAGVYAVNC